MRALPNTHYRLNFSRMRSPPSFNCYSNHSSFVEWFTFALVFLIVLWASEAQAAESLGTLLYSPAQRQAIIALRKRQDGETASLIPLKPSITRLDGVVTRERAKGTSWVNGEPLAQGTPNAPLLRGTEAVVEGRRLRVGESVDTTTGTITDLVAPGAVHKGRTR